MRPIKDPDQTGIVVTSDDWYDTLRIRLVPESAQVLVEWPRGGYPVRLWEEIRNLVLVEEEKA